MAKINENKKIQKRRTADEMNAALTAFCTGTQQVSIPPQMDDSDVVLADCIAELLESRQKLEEIRGWMKTWLATDNRK
jgi:hypothetical protein